MRTGAAAAWVVRTAAGVVAVALGELDGEVDAVVGAIVMAAALVTAALDALSAAGTVPLLVAAQPVARTRRAADTPMMYPNPFLTFCFPNIVTAGQIN